MVNVNMKVFSGFPTTIDTTNPFVVVGCKASQPDDPSYIEDFPTLDQALVAYNACNHPVKTLEYYVLS